MSTQITNPLDKLERTPVDSMSDRELLEEVVHNIRSVQDAVLDLEQMPIIKAMREGKNPLLAMMSPGAK